MALRNAEAVEAMDLMPGLIRRWEADHEQPARPSGRCGVRNAVLVNMTKFLRQMVQIAILGLGAWLVVRHEITGGTMIAGSILLGRALQPVELAVGGWSRFPTPAPPASVLRNSSTARGAGPWDCRCRHPRGT